MPSKQVSSLVSRCVLALLLTIFFYTLALVIAGGLFYISLKWLNSYWGNAQNYGGSLSVRAIILMACPAFLAFIIVVSIWPHINRITVQGIQIRPEEYPQLFKELEFVAEKTGQSVPNEVYIVPDVNAAVSLVGDLMGLGGHKIMLLGLPLLGVLTVPELRAVLAHEFGHFKGKDTMLGSWLCQIRTAVLNAVVNLETNGIASAFEILKLIVGLPFRIYSGMFLAVTSTVSRYQERMADSVSAEVAGADTLISALFKIHVANRFFGGYWQTSVLPCLAQGFCPPILRGFSKLFESEQLYPLKTKLIQEELQNGKTDPYDSHPTLSERISVLGITSFSLKAHSDKPLAKSLLGDQAFPTYERETFKLIDLRIPKCKEMEWDAWLECILLPSWKAMVETHLPAFYGVNIRDLPRLIVPPQSDNRNGSITDTTNSAENFHAKFKDTCTFVKGALTIEEEKKLANAIGAAVALTLHEKGIAFVSQTWEIPLFLCRELPIPPFSLYSDFSDGSISSEQWLNMCNSCQIGEIDLGEMLGCIFKLEEPTSDPALQDESLDVSITATKRSSRS